MENCLAYNGQNQMTGSGGDTTGFATMPTYDAAGDIAYDGSNQYLYDDEGRLCAVQSNGSATGYLYDAAGNRVAKGSLSSYLIPSNACNPDLNGFVQTAGYVTGPSGEQLTEVASVGNGFNQWAGWNQWNHTNVYAGGKLIATYDAPTPGTQLLHFHVDDPLGTRRVQFDANGTIEATYQSLPFGDGYNAIPAPGSPTAEDPTEHHFTAKERDSESGNDYFGARYYASNTGRWLSPDWSSTPDPIPYADIGDPQSLNLYGYVGNNPVTYGDADGHVYQVCDKNGQNCSNMSDPAFEGEESSDKKAGEHFQNGEIFHMENGQKVLDGKFKWLGPDVPGDAAGNQFGANIIGNGGMAAVKFFLTNMVLSATGDAAIGGIKLGAEALMAARAAKAADAAAEATSQSWSLGAFKSSTKWANQLLKRGWTSSEISDTIANGERFPATNNVNPANTATRYVSPSTGKSVVVDDVTQEVIHVGGSGFNY